MKFIKLTIILLVTLFLFTLPAYADGGGPLLLLLNLYLFTLGQIWILLSEGFYIRKLFPTVSLSERIWWVIYFNFISTIAGAFIIPFIWAAIFGLLSIIPVISTTIAGDILTAMGTWVVGDNSPYPWLAITMSGALFVLTYFLTVWIEYKLLIRLLNKNVIPIPNKLMRHSYIFNFISYIGFIILFGLGILLG